MLVKKLQMGADYNKHFLTLFFNYFLHWFLIIGKTVSVVFKEYKIAME